MQALKRQESLSAEEVVRRLRLLGEPATFFGEVSVCELSLSYELALPASDSRLTGISCVAVC